MSKRPNDREQLSLFRALPGGDMALRDAQDLMAYPFFSLAKSRRTVPIRFEAGAVSLTVEGVPEHGIATIWDADVLIWAASQIVQARDEGRPTSRLMAATPYEILRFAQRGTGQTEYLALRASLDQYERATMPALRVKSESLTGYLEQLIDADLRDVLQVVTPRDPAQRGCQLSIRVIGGRERGRDLFDFLATRGVLGDWREPDVIRISPVPLYNTHADVLRFARTVREWRDGR